MDAVRVQEPLRARSMPPRKEKGDRMNKPKHAIGQRITDGHPAPFDGVQKNDGSSANLRELSLEDWEREGNERFGPDKLQWRFQCPNCGHVQTPEDFRQYKDRG